jgi:flavin reductase (DIM6/NTAB) family NADH-FMN oxidoreductase RutF
MPLTVLPVEKAFMLLEPGPVILVTTHDKGRDNIMTISWHMVVDFTPRIALTTGPWNYSFAALMNTKECVLAIPAVDLAEKVVGIGDYSGRDTDKFKKFDLGAARHHPSGGAARLDRSGAEGAPDLSRQRRRHIRCGRKYREPSPSDGG